MTAEAPPELTSLKLDLLGRYATAGANCLTYSLIRHQLRIGNVTFTAADISGSLVQLRNAGLIERFGQPGCDRITPQGRAALGLPEPAELPTEPAEPEVRYSNVDLAIRAAARRMLRKALSDADADIHELVDQLYDTTYQHEAWAANKALEAWGTGLPDTAELEQLRAVLGAARDELLAVLDARLGGDRP